MKAMVRDINIINETDASLEIIDEKSGVRQALRACGKLALLSAISAGAAVASAFMVPTDGTIGPHDVEANITYDGEVTFDLGPLGSIIKPLEDSNGLGAYIKVGEVPVTDGQDLGSEDVEAYARSLSNFEGDIEGLQSDITNQAIKNGLYAGGAALASYFVLGSMGRLKLREAYNESAVARHKRAIGLVGAGLVTTLVLSPVSVSAAEDTGVIVNSSFDGTPLEGARMTGKLLPELINKHGRAVLERLKENDDFYNKARNNIREAFEQVRPMQPNPEYTTVVFYTDVHCNVGMARVIGEFAEQQQARIIADGGDTTMGGTNFEEFCIQVLNKELPDVNRIVSGGNHDSQLTDEQLANNDFRVLNGEVIEVEGLRVLGDDDVMRSEFGDTIRQEGDETILGLGDRLADIACADEQGVDILLVHEPDAAKASIDRGCVTIALSGHAHDELVQLHNHWSGNQTFQLIGDNASGARSDQPSLGPNDSPATFYALKINTETGELVLYQTATINPDASVDISPMIPLSRLLTVQ